MKKFLTVLTTMLFMALGAIGQNLYFIGENSFPCTESITLQSNTDDESDLIILFAKDGKTGLLGVIAESSLGTKFSDKLIIYLDDGTVVTCTQKRATDLVDNLAKAAFSLTSDQLEKLKNSNIHTIRYSLELRTDGGRVIGEKSRTASNKGTQTKTLITEFFDGSYIAKNIKPKEEPKPFEDKPREVDQKQLFPGQKTDGYTSGEGVTGQQGNHGDPSGSTDSQNREGGTAGGGEGISFSLGGRTQLSLPAPEYPKQKSGTVVVEVTVDRNGNVTQVRGGVRGSTTYDTDLIRAAETAARRAKFNVSPSAPSYQTGTITYVFKLQQ
jgi:TonB family protein